MGKEVPDEAKEFHYCVVILAFSVCGFLGWWDAGVIPLSIL